MGIYIIFSVLWNGGMFGSAAPRLFGGKTSHIVERNYELEIKLKISLMLSAR